MHDANGTKLEKGDRVIIEAVIESLSPSEEFCNVSLATVLGRRPDDAKEHICAINTAVIVKMPLGK
jgi:hypothetical protein